MGRNLMGLWALGLTMGLAVSRPALAGDRKLGAASNPRITTAHALAVAAQPRASADAARNTKILGHDEYSFGPVRPLIAKAPARREIREHGPTTAPSERKTVTFFRLNPRYGDVSVQPVAGGGVNGAQVAVGF